ncbi:MAG TPA: hypothetical protein VFC68_01615 [Treponemataceae bacterium]|nr:hypothetical protein [Treponemataceae bacterium]
MNKKTKQVAKIMRQLVANIQGAPYPGDLSNELYTIWYEHIQRDAMSALEYIDENFPHDISKDIDKTMEKVF